MEGLHKSVRFQHDEKTENNFLEFGFPTHQPQEAITALQDLPHNYRDEIEKGFSTGWRCVDEYLQGVRAGEITVVTADTGVGKTTFCTQLMVNCATQGVPVWINSWEMKPQTIMRKLASIILRKPMKLQNFTEEDSNGFDVWTSQFRAFVNPNTIGTTIDSFANDLKLAKDLGIRVVMIDHLDYLVNSRREKVHEAIDETIKRLHELAFSFSMHFVLICHPRQSASSGEEIGIHALKGSSSIKQYADNVIILHRCARTDPQSHPGKTKIKIAKNRMFGIEGNTYLFYQPLWDGYVEFKEA